MSLFEWLSVITAISSVLLTVIGVLFWYIIKSTIAGLNEVKNKLEEHKLEVVRTYARQADVKASFDTLSTKMEDLKDTTSKINLTVATIAAKMKIDI